MKRFLLLAAGAVVVASGATAAVLALPDSASPPVTTTAGGCTIQPGKLPPGRYDGTVPISGTLASDREAPGLGPIHDEQTDTGTMTIAMAVSEGQEVTGSWRLATNLSTTITIQRTGKQWITPGVIQLDGGRVAGTAEQLHLTGGDGSSTHYPGGGIVTRYPIVDGVVDYPPLRIRDRIDVAATVDSVTCEELRGTVSYPIGLFNQPTGARQPQTWVAKRTASSCDDEPKFTITEKLKRVTAATVDQFTTQALGTGQPAGRTHDLPNTRDWKTNQRTNLVERANLVWEIVVDRPVWQLTPDAAMPPEDVKLLDRIVDMIRVHEAKHVANYETAARRYVCESHGKTVDAAKTLLNKTMLCAIIRANRALDLTEGKLIPVLDKAGKLIDAKYVPETNEATLPQIPTDCG
jgi:hypothetical protein